MPCFTDCLSAWRLQMLFCGCWSLGWTTAPMTGEDPGTTGSSLSTFGGASSFQLGVSSPTLVQMFLCATPARWLGCSIYAAPASLSQPASGPSLHSLHLGSGLVGSIPPSITPGFRVCFRGAVIIQEDSLLHRSINKKFFFFSLSRMFFFLCVLSCLKELWMVEADDHLFKDEGVEGPRRRTFGEEKNLQQLLKDSFHTEENVLQQRSEAIRRRATEQRWQRDKTMEALQRRKLMFISTF